MGADSKPIVLRNLKQYNCIVEQGREGSNGKPSVGPVYRSILSKDGFPPAPPGMDTCWDIFSNSAKRNPNNKLLGWRETVSGKAGPYLWLKYHEVYDQALKIGSAMRTCGIKPRDKCGIYGGNCPQWAIAMEACNAHSVACVPLYDTLGANAVEFIIRHAEIPVAFTQEVKLSELLKSLPNCLEFLRVVVSFGSLSEQQRSEIESHGLKAFSWKEFLDLGAENPVDLNPPRGIDICTIMYTSGTTGEPKGVLLTHESVALMIGAVDFWLTHFEEKMTPEDSYLSFLPLAHIFDRIIEEYFIYWGASIGYWRGDPKLLMEDLQELKPSLFVGVPKVFDRIYGGAQRWLNGAPLGLRLLFNACYKYKYFWMSMGYTQAEASPLADTLIFNRIKKLLGGKVRLLMSGAAPLASHVEEFLRVTTCAMMVQGYGLTETCSGSFCCVPDDISMIGTVGVPSPSIEVRLESVPEMGYDALAEVPRGEICMRSKIMFSGYYKREDLTREVMVDGWFHTGDIGEWQPNGSLKIIDRKKNIFKLAQGEYVAVEHLEMVYGMSLYVDAVWVYGNSFESFLVAVVVPNEQSLQGWAAANGLKGEMADLCKEKKVQDFLFEELTAIGKKQKLKGFEMIKAIYLEPVLFDVERDLITPTYKKRRPQLLKYYQDVIDNLYKKVKQQQST
ncbi:hypothetical protein KP509_24G023000 [Ceratopteris richardii]|uniref:Long-chain-fatty-acid--CoA ligase n=1 Tax=Ceratopteris richardii TaxID=49495 RepID=A0A8T2RV93_CERRI|nr:hypothetical protein KP509_24G023000 [Ceratopteris richardii]